MLANRTAHPAASAELQSMDRTLAVIVIAPDGTILRANANFLQLCGYKARELVGQPRALFVPPQAGEAEADASRWDAVLSGAPQVAEFPRLHKDGSLIWVRAQYTPISDDDGRVTEVVVFATDITEAKRRAADGRGQIQAIQRSQAVIHFALDGSITDANAHFLQTTGYSLAEVVGRHHRMFVDDAQAQGQAYRSFWEALVQGQHQAGIFRRLGKNGREIWLQATYSPIFDMNGQPFKVVKYATDVTADRTRQAGHEGQIDAINKSHGVITFDMNGTVLDANDNLLQALGYRLDEIEGRHHRMFVDPSFAHGPEYANFWNHLSDGRHQAGEYKRFGKNGREVWLQASYNPIHDLNGKPVKVVKYATVITREKLRSADHQGQIASIHKVHCVISFALDGTVLDANDNFLDATGYRLSEVRGRHHRMFVDEATAGSADYLAFWDDLARGRHRAGEFKRRCKDGREIWLQATYNPIFDMSGRPFKVVKYATDITADRLRQVDNEGQIAAIHKSQCVAVFDMDGALLSANDNVLAAMGHALHEVQGRHHSSFVDPAVAGSDAFQAFWATLRAGRFVFQKTKCIGKGGKPVWLQASYNPILDLNGQPCKVLMIATDVTAEVAMAADFVHARRQALHDAATALPNRVALLQFMAAALRRPGQRLAILYLDLDHFKPINDTFGHDIGDLVLRETARRLSDVTGPDQIAARIGGDEFVVAAPELSDAQVDALCQRLIDVVQAPIHHDKCLLTVGLSIGVALSPHDATGAEDLLRCADVALYRTKGSGRGGYSFFAAEMDERLSADRHLAEEMRHGIKAGQFFLEYQPRLDARTRRLHGAEAHVRWAHPVRGRLEPGDFLNLAEKSGLIVPLGDWVLRSACQAAAGWPGVVVSVKVSPIQFAGTDLAQAVAAALALSGLPAHRLELEMTERLLTEDVARVETGLRALKALGVCLALDDYGAHHGSLASVRAFPFDSVRIDPRYLADLEGEAGGRRIVQDVLRLNQALAVPLAVQGVELSGQLLVLGLDERAQVQAFLTATALPAQAVERLLRQDAEAPADDVLTAAAALQ